MITRENLKEVIASISGEDQKRIKESNKDYCVLTLHIFNSGSNVTIQLTDDYNRYKNVYKNGNCILETGDVINFL